MFACSKLVGMHVPLHLVPLVKIQRSPSIKYSHPFAFPFPFFHLLHVGSLSSKVQTTRVPNAANSRTVNRTKSAV